MGYLTQSQRTCKNNGAIVWIDEKKTIYFVGIIILHVAFDLLN
jgi:hypothetical protein